MSTLLYLVEYEGCGGLIIDIERYTVCSLSSEKETWNISMDYDMLKYIDELRYVAF